MTGDVVAFPQAPEGIEVRHLRAFIAVAEELNFSRAAARMYLSQPALSRQIRGLERLLGCELLRRSTHRVELTVAGSALLDRARRLLADLDEAIAATQSVGGELANRMATMWAPVFEVVAADRDIQEMRATYESFLAQTALPEGIEVRPVNAGGVSSLELAPGGAEGGPAVLYLHGGGYILGSAYGYRPLVGALVAASGVGALVADFRLAPEHPFPAAVEDALSAYRWLAEQRRGVVVAGDSAGAGLAFSLLVTLKAQGLPLPAGVVCLSPGFDLTGTPHLSADRETVASLLRSADAYLADHPADDPVVNPLTADLTGMPPVLIQSGTGDFALPQARALAEHALQHGVDARLELYPADTHVFHVFWSFLPEAADALRQAGGFMREVLSVDRAAASS